MKRLFSPLSCFSRAERGVTYELKVNLTGNLGFVSSDSNSVFLRTGRTLGAFVAAGPAPRAVRQAELSGNSVVNQNSVAFTLESSLAEFHITSQALMLQLMLSLFAEKMGTEEYSVCDSVPQRPCVSRAGTLCKARRGTQEIPNNSGWKAKVHPVPLAMWWGRGPTYWRRRRCRRR